MKREEKQLGRETQWPEDLLKDTEEKLIEIIPQITLGLKKFYCTFDKEFLCPLKSFLASKLHLRVRNDFIPCHLCSHLYELGVKHREKIGAYKLSPVQRDILDELELCSSLGEEGKIADPAYSKKTNYVRRRAAERLEKHYLIVTRKRAEPKPENPHNWREVTKATLTPLGAIVANKMSQKGKDNPERFLLEPERALEWYLQFLEEEKNFLREAKVAQTVRERIKRRKKKPAEDFELFEKPDTLSEAMRTLIAILIEIGTIKDLLRGEAIPEDPYAAAAEQICDVLEMPDLEGTPVSLSRKETNLQTDREETPVPLGHRETDLQTDPEGTPVSPGRRETNPQTDREGTPVSPGLRETNPKRRVASGSK